MTDLYPRVDAQVQQIRELARLAMVNDVRENVLVITRLEKLAENILQPWYAASILADAYATWGRISAGLTGLQAHHDWLSASEKSPRLLMAAVTEWQSMVGQQKGVVQSVRRRRQIVQSSEWEGESQKGHVRGLSLREQKEVTFAESVEAIVGGCTRATNLTNALLAQALTFCGTATARCSVAGSAPSGSSPMPRNWRMRKVEQAVNQARAEYGRLQSGAGWRSEADAIGAIFQAHATTITALQAMSRAGGPLAYTAM